MPKPVKGTISGSTAATILGLNEFETPFTRWQLIMEDLHPGFNADQGYDMPEPFEGNAATRWGHAFEPSVIKLTERKFDCLIEKRESVFYHALLHLSCHVDGIINPFGPWTTDFLYEGKTANQMVYRNKFSSDKIPRNYFIQVQHNMFLTECSHAIVSVLVLPKMAEEWEQMGWELKFEDSDRPFINNDSDQYEFPHLTIEPLNNWAQALAQMGYFHTYEIDRDDELITTMLEKYQEWWSKHIIEKTPPEPMNVDDIKRLVPEPVGTIVLDDGFLIDTLTEYRDINKEIGASGTLGKRKAQLKTLFLDGLRSQDAVKDEESTDKWIVRDTQGKKLAQWSKDKKGVWVLR